MAIRVTMPALSPTMTDGTLSKWLVKEGDPVKPGLVIAEIETDKAAMEFEAVDSGTMGKIIVPEGTQGVRVGELIGVIMQKNENSSHVDAEIEKYKSESNERIAPISETVNSKNENTKASQEPEIKNPETRTLASPLAKRIAEQRQINIDDITGSGPKGRVIKQDIELRIEEKTSTNSILNNNLNGKSIPHTTMRRVIADRLNASKKNSPHFYLSIECNVSNLFSARKNLNSIYSKHIGDEKFSVSVNDMMIKASAIALRECPYINCSWTENEIVIHGSIDVSVAVSIPGGLITPIVKNADKIGLAELSRTTKDLIKRARDGKLRSDEFQGGTFSVSNLGMYGIKEFFPIINPPQSAILSIGAPEKKVLVLDDGSFVASEVMLLGLSVDHRSIDGSQAALFLQTIKNIIENPTMLAI